MKDIKLNFQQQKLFQHIIESKDLSFLIIGEHESGKTVLLRTLEKHFQNQKRKVIFIDAQEFALQPDSLLYFLARELNLSEDENLSRLWDRIKSEMGRIKPLIFIDELEVFPIKFHWFFRALLSIGHCDIITSIEKMYRYRPGRVGSPLDNILHKLNLHQGYNQKEIFLLKKRLEYTKEQLKWLEKESMMDNRLYKELILEVEIIEFKIK